MVIVHPRPREGCDACSHQDSESSRDQTWIESWELDHARVFKPHNSCRAPYFSEQWTPPKSIVVAVCNGLDAKVLDHAVDARGIQRKGKYRSFETSM
jgi:hypothetical protein